jgi:hypothetical protein
MKFVFEYKADCMWQQVVFSELAYLQRSDFPNIKMRQITGFLSLSGVWMSLLAANWKFFRTVACT